MFPVVGDEFPSAEWAAAFAQYEANDAWYSGDQAKLQAVYAWTAGAGTRGDDPATHYHKASRSWRKGGARGWLSRMFNGRVVEDPGEHRTRIHAPVAGNLATLASDLLFAEPPTFRIYNAEGKPTKDRTQARLDAVLNSERTHRTLSHAGEETAGISAVVLTAHWDREISDVPWLQATSADAAVPEFVAGRLAAVNLYTTYPTGTGSGQVYCHVERHEVGAIVHALLLLENGKVAGVARLEDRPETAHIPRIGGAVAGPIDGSIALPTGIRQLTAAWWRHLPTRAFRKHGALALAGRAVFEGAEQMLDAVDEVWSSWMRDVKIARARLIVPEAFLDVQGPGLGGAFDDDRELLTGLAFTDLGGVDRETISAHQFAIRAEEHAATLLGLTREITQHAGYSLSSYSESQSSGGVTATEVTDRTTMTERTRDKQRLYFVDAGEPIARALMALDAVHYSGRELPADVDLRIEIPPLSQIDPEKEARIMGFLRSAQAASTDTLVRMQHKDWEETQIQEEIDRIRQENGLDDEQDPALLDRVPPGAGPAADESGNPIEDGQDPNGERDVVAEQRARDEQQRRAAA